MNLQKTTENSDMLSRLEFLNNQYLDLDQNFKNIDKVNKKY